MIYFHQYSNIYIPSECYLPAKSGVCLAAFTTYYFDSKSNACEKFVYGGCGGNNNRFFTQKQCLERCGSS